MAVQVRGSGFRERGASSGGAADAVTMSTVGERWQCIDDFVNSAGFYSYSVSGAGAQNSYTRVASRPHCLQHATGTTATGRALAFTNTAALSLDAQLIWEADINLQQLSTALEEFTWRIGLHDNVAAAEAADGCYFEYDRTVGTEWRCVTSSASVRTKTATAITVAANAWINLRIVATLTAVQFYINGTLVATNTTNIPTVAQTFGSVSQFAKTVGTTSVTAAVDFIAFGGERAP